MMSLLSGSDSSNSKSVNIMAASEQEGGVFSAHYYNKHKCSHGHHRRNELCKSYTTKSRPNVNSNSLKYASRHNVTLIALSILTLTATKLLLANCALTPPPASISSSTTNTLSGADLAFILSSGRLNLTNELPIKSASNAGKNGIPQAVSSTTTATATTSTTTAKAPTSTENQSVKTTRTGIRNTNGDNSQTTVANDLAASPSSISSSSVRLNFVPSSPPASYSTTESVLSSTQADSRYNVDTSTMFSNRRLLAASRASDASDWSTPATSGSSLLLVREQSGSNNNYGVDPQQQQIQRRRQNIPAAARGAQVESQSTSQVSRFVEPSVSTTASASSNSQTRQNSITASKVQPQQRYKSQKSASNKWTHFGARLKPLASGSTSSVKSNQSKQQQQAPINGGSENHIGAASSSSPAAALTAGAVAQFNGPENNNYLMQAAGGLSKSAFVGDNSVDSNDNEAASDDDNDDEDDEKLLYEMMQQPTYLMNPNMADTAANINNNSGAANQRATRPNHGNVRPAVGSNGNGNGGDDGNGGGSTTSSSSDMPANSKKVIKLLKSYSHIHQVDDSDDQIRGTYTRLSARRPQTDSGNYQQQRPLQQHRPQSTAAPARRYHNKGQHSIFVKPVAQASGQQANRQRMASINQQIASANDNGNYNSGNSLDSDATDPDSNGQSSQSAGVDPNGPGASGSEEEEFECPNNGIFADVASGCQAYHVCQSGAQVQQRFQCPLGTLFNDIILTCDFAHNVQCNGQAKPMVQAWPDQGGAGDDGSSGHNQQPIRASANNQQQLPTGWTQSRAQQLQQQMQANGPRQLMIGSQNSRPNGQQSVNRQTTAAAAHPQLQAQLVAGSGASQVSHPQPQPNGGATGNAADDSSDDSDDNEPLEPLVPATLPPRRAPKVTIASQLPPLSPPPAPQPHQHQHQQQQQQQYQSQNYRQTAHLSQYPQHQQQQVNSNGYHRQASPAIIYGQSAGNSIAYGDGTSATTPVRAGTGQYSTEPTNAIGSSTSGPSNSNSNSDAQSFNLVINHVTPTHSKLQQQQPQQQYSSVRPNGKPINNNGNNNNFIENPQKSYANGNKHQQQVSPKATQPIVYVSGAAGGHKQQQQQQHNNPAFVPSATAATAATITANQSPKAQQQPQTSTTYLSNGNNFAANRSPQQQQRVSRRQPQQQRQQYEHSSSSQSTPTTTASTTTARANQPALVDLNNAKQAQGVSSDAINDGLLLIVRHSSGSNPLQLTTRPAHQTTYSNEQLLHAHSSNKSPTGRRSARQQPLQQHNGQAYIVDPSIVNPSSQIDAQLFPNVQQLVADKQQQQSHVAPRQQLLITAATRQAINSAQVAYDNHLQQQQQVSSGPRTALASMTSATVAAPLPPMEPPRPQMSVTKPTGEPMAATDEDRPPSYGPAANELHKSYATLHTSVATANPPEKPLGALDANGSSPDRARYSSDQQQQASQGLQSSKQQPEVRKTKRLKPATAPLKSAKGDPLTAKLSKQGDQPGKVKSAAKENNGRSGRPTSVQQDKLASQQQTQ